MLGFAAPRISCTDSECSSALSTAVTKASESSTPQGVRRAKDLRYQSVKSVRPDLRESRPSPS